MSSAKDSFVSKPSTSSLKKVKCTKLVEAASYYELTVSSLMNKNDICQVILEYLREEELLSDKESDNGQEAGSATLELKRLEFQENERARENTLYMKELEIKEKELAMQLKLKELEAKTMSPYEPHSKSVGFDIILQAYSFCITLQEWEIDKYFLHFEKVATSLEWPRDTWTLLLQSVLVGKAWEIYTALSLHQSLEYGTVKTAILNVYELVPKAYWQKFRGSTKGIPKHIYRVCM